MCREEDGFVKLSHVGLGKVMFGCFLEKKHTSRSSSLQFGNMSLRVLLARRMLPPYFY